MEKKLDLRLYVRLLCGKEIALGPGKADLLDAIIREGSISAAGRSMGISYRRAWLMVDVMNRGFVEPVIQSAHGGKHGGGAQVTPFGQDILKRYRAMQAETEAVARRHFQDIGKLMKPDVD